MIGFILLGVVNFDLIVGPATRELHMFIARRNVGMARQDALAVLGFFYRYLAQLVQTLGERAGKTRRHVLGYQQRGA